jgi:predicted dehydrogenase/nucleoside-diphosphate-sugar epimerase
MRIGIVGAGNNANYHVRFAKEYKDCEIVGIVDRDLAKAHECARQYGVSKTYESVSALLTDARPDVAHVVTPPSTHFAVVRELLEARCHVIVEKPLALNTAEAETLYALAEQHGVRLCPVHNHLFDPCMREANAMITAGTLGDVVNVESYYGLNTDIPPFREYPKPNVLPWLYGLPGGVYQDFLPHPVYALLEYTGAPRSLTVKHRTTGVLPQNLPDEIRVLVDGEHALGTITVSFAAKPHLHFLRVYGTNGMVEVDFNTMTTTVHAVSSLPKAAQKATYNLDESLQKTRRTFANTFQFLTGKLKPYQGMMTLIHAFYDSIKHGGPTPVSKTSALSVVTTMDAVFEQLNYQPLMHEDIIPAPAAPEAPRVLVTGGTGFVGRALVRRLLNDGYRVRVLARKLSRARSVADTRAEIFWGDVADSESFDRAMTGCDFVVHLAAGTSGSERDSQTATLQGTRLLLELCTRHKPRRLVYISSCSVYGVADCPANGVIAENTPLERMPERRGSYSASKQQAEDYVTEFARSETIPTVILRPGTIYGPGGDLFTPLMGFGAGSTYVVIGNGDFVLPFVYVENLLDAIILSMEKPEAVGETFNVVDPERLTKRHYIDHVVRRVDREARVVYLPYSMLYGITWMQELAFGAMGRNPVLSRYRLTSSQKCVVYDSQKIASKLGWRPSVPLSEALDHVVASERAKRSGQPASPPSDVMRPAAASQSPARPQ